MNVGPTRLLLDSPDLAAFRILAYETAGDDLSVADKKVRRKLKRDDLGTYSAERVALIREVKNDLRKDIDVFGKSKY